MPCGMSETGIRLANRQGQKEYFSPRLNAQYSMSSNFSVVVNGVFPSA